MKPLPSIILFAVIILGIYTLVQSTPNENWQPVYYPNTENLSIYSYGPVLDTLEQCRGWINAESMKRSQEFGEFDYECGLNCKYDMIYDLQICEETLQ